MQKGFTESVLVQRNWLIAAQRRAQQSADSPWQRWTPGPFRITVRLNCRVLSGAGKTCPSFFMFEANTLRAVPFGTP